MTTNTTNNKSSPLCIMTTNNISSPLRIMTTNNKSSPLRIMKLIVKIRVRTAGNLKEYYRLIKKVQLISAAVLIQT